MTTPTRTLPDGREYRVSIEGMPPRTLAPKKLARIATIVALTITMLYFILPIIWVMFSATKSNADLVSTNGFWFGHFELGDNYTKLMGWTQGLFWRWVLNSLFYSTAAGIIGTLISYVVFHNLGLTDTVWAILIPSCVSPFGVFLGRVYADSSVPTELIEAARIDGASEARVFFTIVLRLLAPAMVTIFLFIFVATWNNFLLPLMMVSTAELKPVTLGLYGMMSYFTPQKGAVMLGALLGVLPLIVLFLGLQKYWQSGLAAGSVKG